MVMQFFYVPLSPPSRMVLMTLKALGLEFELKTVNLMGGEQKKPEFLAINPRGKVPALKDGKFVIAESRAISTYVCNQYEKGNDSTRLYPVDPKKRGLVDQILYVSENTDDQIHSYLNTGGVLFRGEKICDDKLSEAHKALQLYEGYLEQNNYVAGDHLTLADFYMLSPLLLLMNFTDFNDFGNYPKTAAWLKKMKALPYFNECNKEGLATITKMYKDGLQKLNA